ncbi:hypothetical protein ACIQAC_14950 [Streptomyces sp. NPDC088387]|uniref:hypothetical protein n=1 Tax=Streptomyces sp. NPDC088387 TaxID=3365859 RepID=UPI00382762ED
MADERLDRWGVQVARWAAPGETVLAAQITRAYAGGGTGRRELFRAGGLAPGGIGGGIATVLPEVLDALAYSAEAVKAALASQEFANAVSVTALLVSLRGQGPTPGSGSGASMPGPAPEGERGVVSGPGSGPESGAGSGSGSGPESGLDRGPGAGPTPGPRPEPGVVGGPGQGVVGGPEPGAVAPVAETVLAALRMCERLHARGVDRATAEDIVAPLTARLLAAEDPADVAAFLDALVAQEPPEPTVRPPASPGTALRRLAGTVSGLLRRHPDPGPHGRTPGT